MKIKGLEISNFRGIDKLNLEFRSFDGKASNMAVLAGPNGCGKTSVMEACLLVLGRDMLIQAMKEKDKNSRTETDNYELSAILEHRGEEISVRRTSGMKFQQMETQIGLKDFPAEYFSSWRYPKLVGTVSVTSGKRGKRPYGTEENRIWLLKQYLVNLTASKAFEGSQFSNLRNEEENAYEKINQIWKYFYPNRDEKFVARRVSKDISEGFDIFLEGRKDSLIPLDSLSSGEIEILTLLGQIIKAPLRGGILFIDEPELHLHSSWHRVILRALRKTFPDTQIICATHSHEILDSVYSYERFTLLSEQDPRIRLDRSVSSNSGKDEN